MELEEAIERLKVVERQKDYTDNYTREDLNAIETVLYYIKEESISKAVVEEVKTYIEYYAMDNFALTDFNLREKTFRHILEILNKGEK